MVPESVPDVSGSYKQWSKLKFHELAFEAAFFSLPKAFFEAFFMPFHGDFEGKSKALGGGNAGGEPLLQHGRGAGARPGEAHAAQLQGAM